MSNVDKLNGLKPEGSRAGVTKEELVAIKAARDRGCTWRQIWQAGDWPYKSQQSFVTSVTVNKDYPRG
jgi:hypothetical protein